MTDLPADFSMEAVAAIGERLAKVRDDGARILFAIESGSRAWGFPSPDSDYDCRFVYVRSPSQHYVLEQPRDVIEFPVEGDIDAGGWDLRKALLLALGGNAVVVEWANSPISYEEVPGFRPRLRQLLHQIVDPSRVARHYLGLARSHIGRIGGFSTEVKLKKLFYLVRPIVALDWMEQRAFGRLPQMSLTANLEQTDMPQDARLAIHHLIEAKSRTRELGTGPIPLPIANYLEARYSHHDANMTTSMFDAGQAVHARALAEAFYRGEVEATQASV